MRTQTAAQSFLNNRLARNLRPLSIEWYRGKLAKFISLFPEIPTDPDSIEQFLLTLPASPETKLNYYKFLKMFYHFVNQRYNTPDPMQQITPPRRPRKLLPTLEPRQVMQLINQATNLRDKTLVTLFVDTGARLSELAYLRKQDIGDNSITVNGKTGEREIPISDETKRLISTLLASNGHSDYLFTNYAGRPFTRYGVYYVIHSLMEKAGIPGPKLGPHRIRHAFGRAYLVNGGDIRSLQLIMGHADITTTQKYASLNLSDLQNKHHRFTPLRTAHLAAQESLFDSCPAINEANLLIKSVPEV